MKIKKIPVQLAADLMGKNYNFLRIGLQRGILPIGTAIKMHEEKKIGRYTYYVSPALFMAYTGCTEEDIIHAAKDKGYKL